MPSVLEEEDARFSARQAQQLARPEPDDVARRARRKPDPPLWEQRPVDQHAGSLIRERPVLRTPELAATGAPRQPRAVDVAVIGKECDDRVPVAVERLCTSGRAGRAADTFGQLLELRHRLGLAEER